MFHIIYKIQHENGKYYIGRHSTKNLNDNYLGSGKWVKSIKDKSSLSKLIIDYADDFEDLKTLEEKYILKNINDENYMNFNNSSVGFGSGDYNPSKKNENRRKISERVSGKNNPMHKCGHTEESKEKNKTKN